MNTDDIKDNIKRCDSRIADLNKQIEQIQTFQETVKTGVVLARNKKYKPLIDAHAKYGERWQDIQEAYGWGAMSAKTYDSLTALHYAQEDDVTETLMKGVLQHIDGQITITKHTIEAEEKRKAYWQSQLETVSE